MRGDKQLKIGMMVRGYLPLPRPADMVYSPMDMATELGRELTDRGHQVDFFAPLGSEISGSKVHSANLRALAHTNEEFQKLLASGEPINHHLLALWDNYLAEEMFEAARRGEYDILHFHHPEVALSLARKYHDIPVVYTQHDPIFPWYKELYELYDSPNQHFVSISNNQRRDAPDLNYAATVYNGIDTTRFAFAPEHEDYLLYTGRIVPEKGVKEAVQVAEATNSRLIITGPTYPTSQGYFDQYIKPHLNDKILYLGYIEREKILPYYQHAKALLMPIQWEEPFGITTIETMACGTPTIAFTRGSMPEIIQDGKTGYLVTSVGEMVKAVGKLNKIDRRACREYAKSHFSSRQMTDGYEAVYHQVLATRSPALKIQSVLNKNVRKSISKTKKSVSKLRPPK